MLTELDQITDARLAALLRKVHDAGGDNLTAWGREVAPLAVGVIDASALIDRLAVRRLRESVLPLAPQWPEPVRDQTIAAIEQTIAAIEHGGDRSAAWAAAGEAAESAAAWAATAWAVRSAAESAWAAVRSAAWAAAGEAAESAAEAARSAAWAATWAAAAWAARSAAWRAERERILEELRRAASRRNAPARARPRPGGARRADEASQTEV